MSVETLRQLYLDLIKKNLAGLIYEDQPLAVMAMENYVTKDRPAFIRKLRELGRDYPSQAHTAIGLRRLDNVQRCFEQVLAEDIPGDVIETGVFRGGAVIFMRALLKAHQVTDRIVWAADSFEGLPKPNLELYPKDEIWGASAGLLVASLEEVQQNFARYGLLDDQVRFLKGWFHDTLPSAPINRLAILRLDGDLYGSTMVALEQLYPKVSKGGYIIVDDYHHAPCRAAVDDYWDVHRIQGEIVNIDGRGAFWRKEG